MYTLPGFPVKFAFNVLAFIDCKLHNIYIVFGMLHEGLWVLLYDKKWTLGEGILGTLALDMSV